MDKRWKVLPADPDGQQALAAALRVSPVVAQLLINRGLRDAPSARSFLRPELGQLHAPELLPGIAEATDRIHAAVARGDTIFIYGDYDVDGITGVSVLYDCLRLAGAKVEYYVPHRLEEGYGLNVSALEWIAEQGGRLVVTVDCGIGSLEEAGRAHELGLELVVTDHHEPGEVLPEADAIVHPGLPGSRYPFAELAGAGVAFKLAWALAQRFSHAEKVTDEFRQFLVAGVALVALGTVADVVPLVDENRVLVSYGLRALADRPSQGIQALMDVSGLADAAKVDAYDVGFQLAPRLNAVGRLGHARLAIELMTTPNPDRARQIAEFLDSQNQQRRKLERRLFRELRDRVEQEIDLDKASAIVLGGEGWHAGVIGIVASRLVDAFYRPTILVALGDELGQGSGRSIPGFHLFEAVQACSEGLSSYGGHAQAVGVRMPPEHFPTFQQRFLDYCQERLRPSELVREIVVDVEADLDAVTLALLDELSRLAPFGKGNPRPVMISRNVRVVGKPRRVGGGGHHLQFMVRAHSAARKAIAFGMGRLADKDLTEGQHCDLVFQPKVNEWRGRRSVDLQIEDLRIGASDGS